VAYQAGRGGVAGVAAKGGTYSGEKRHNNGAETAKMASGSVICNHSHRHNNNMAKSEMAYQLNGEGIKKWHSRHQLADVQRK